MLIAGTMEKSSAQPLHLILVQLAIKILCQKLKIIEKNTKSNAHSQDLPFATGTYGHITYQILQTLARIDLFHFMIEALVSNVPGP